MNNEIRLVGRPTKAPELTWDLHEATVTVSLEVNRPGVLNEEKKTDVIPCKFMGDAAQDIAEYVTQGRLIRVIGSYRIEGKYTYIQGEEFILLGGIQ